MDRIPMAIASALLAGVLARFGPAGLCGGPDRVATGAADAGQLPAVRRFLPVMRW